MSVYITGSIWKYGPSQPTPRYVLLAIGDNANDEGFCFPSIDTIANKSVLSKRQVMRVIQNLEKDDWLTVSRDERAGKGSTYQINLSKLNISNSGDKLSRDKKTCDIQSGTQVTFATDSGDICDNVIRNNRQEPSIEPSNTAVSPKKGESAVDHQLGLKTRIKEFICKVQIKKAKLSTAPWNGREGKVLSQMVKENPSWTEVDWRRMLKNWANSSPERVNFGDRAGKWLGNISKFSTGPLLAFGSVGKGFTASKDRTVDADDEITRMYGDRG